MDSKLIEFGQKINTKMLTNVETRLNTVYWKVVYKNQRSGTYLIQFKKSFIIL